VAQGLAFGLPQGSHADPIHCGPSPQSTFPWENEGSTDYDYHLRPSGQLDAVMIFVDFPDAMSDEPTEPLFDQLAVPAMEWYETSAAGAMTFEITPVHEWFRMPQASSVYDIRRDGGLTVDGYRAYLQAAVDAADAAVDFTGYELLYVVASKGSVNDYSPAYIDYQGVVADGNTIRYGSGLGSDVWLRPEDDYGAMTLAHETGHTFGLPDLYDYNGASYEDFHRWAGSWDTMGLFITQGDFMTWHKWKMGWYASEQIVCIDAPGVYEIDLTPVSQPGGTKAAFVMTSPTTAIVAEARSRTGLDAEQCDEGVLVYSVDMTVASGAGPIRLASAHPGGDTDPTRLYECGPLYNAPYDVGAGEQASFTDAVAGVSIEVTVAGASFYSVTIDSAADPFGCGIEGCGPDPVEQERSITLSLKRHLRVSGAITLPVPGENGCLEDAVFIERKRGEVWKPVKTLESNESGAFGGRIPDRPGRYRVIVTSSLRGGVSCLAATSPVKRHRH
jgi:M6 family metalloprotease-like protein